MRGAAAPFVTGVAALRFEWLRPPSAIRLPQILVAVFVSVIGFLVCYPLVMLLGSFAPPRGSTAVFSLDGYHTALFDEDARRAIVTTVWLALVRAALASGLAIFLSWAITRTNIPGRRWFHNLLILHFFLPLLPQVVAWSLLLSPRSGLVNVWLRQLVGSDSGSGPLNLYSYGGIISFSGRLAGRASSTFSCRLLARRWTRRWRRQRARREPRHGAHCGASPCHCCCRRYWAASVWPSCAWSSHSRSSCFWEYRPGFMCSPFKFSSTSTQNSCRTIRRQSPCRQYSSSSHSWLSSFRPGCSASAATQP